MKQEMIFPKMSLKFESDRSLKINFNPTSSFTFKPENINLKKAYFYFSKWNYNWLRM